MNASIKILSIFAAAIAMAACAHKDDGDLGHHHHDHGHAHEHAHEGHAGEIELEPEMAEQFGVATETAEPRPFRQVLRVAGQIVDSPNSSAVAVAPTSGIVKFLPGMAPGKAVGAGAAIASVSADKITGGNADAAAKAALDAAKAELDRITPLYEHKLVTAADYQAAALAYEQAKAAYSVHAASGRAVAPLAGVITELLAREGEYVDAGAPIAAISSTKRLTLRADVPEKHFADIPAFATANIVLPYGGGLIELASHGGKRESSGQAVSAQRGYIPVYFTFDNDGSVMPGAYVDVNLIGGEKGSVISVPVGAISEQQGAYFVYEQLDEECYRKIPVRLGASDGARVEVVSGLDGGEHVVVSGMVGVRLAESSAVSPEGHSHNH